MAGEIIPELRATPVGNSKACSSQSALRFPESRFLRDRSIAGTKQKGLSVQEASERLTSIVLGLPGHAGIRCAIETVIRPRIYV